MSRMLRPYKAENIMGDFSPGTQYRGDDGAVIRLGNDGRPFFEMSASDGHLAKYHVDFTIGSKWQQGYVTRLPDGRMQVLPIEYNKIHGQWVNYWKWIDPPSSDRADISKFPRLLPATNYQLNCAMCHTSRLRAASTLEESMMQARFQEAGIDCEMCHGPSKQHVDRMQRENRNYSIDSTGTDGLAAPVNFQKTKNREEIKVCAQCHRQSAEREASVHNELNYSSTGPSFLLPSVSRNYPEFLRRAFYKDGRFRETTFIVEAFTRSACYRQGTARCSSCHDPHPVDAATNPASLKFLDHPDQRCLQCHEKFQNSPERHTHHAASSEGSRCEACHMPRIMNSVMFEARSHEIDDLPDAGMTARFGQKDSPNACLLCHTEKDTAWVSDKLAHW
jgi:predicted CXXCH cytochrome family protein